MSATPIDLDWSRPVIEIRDHLQYTFQGTQGYVCVATLDRSSMGHQLNEQFFHWPNERSRLTNYVVKMGERAWTEVYYCPYPMEARQRIKGSSLSRTVVHTDIDKPLSRTLRDRLESWGFRINDSGTDGHLHAYAKLSRSLTPAEYDAAERALRELVGGDSKISDNDLLRLPGTWNYKNHPSVKPEKRIPEQKLSSIIVPGRHRVDADQLLKKLGARARVTLARDDTKVRRSKETPREIPAYIRRLMAEEADGDRSTQCFRAVCTVAKAGYSREEIHTMLVDYAPGVDKWDDRWPAELDRAYDKWADEQPKELEAYDVDEHFWGRSDLLQHIYHSSKAGRVNPWITFGVVLLRVMHVVPVTVQQPPLGGSRALNMFIAAVGSSGLGKGTASRVAKTCLDGLLIEQDCVTLGSGEGLVKAYRRAGKGAGEPDVVIKRSAVLFEAAEGTTMTKLFERAGTTLLPELCKGWSGERLGFQNADDSKAIQVDADSYRMGLIIGIQPEVAGDLMKAAGTGLTQRFLYLPVADPDMPDERPPTPEPVMWKRPDWPEDGKKYSFPVPAEVVAELDEAIVAKHRGEEVVDPLDSHLGQIKLKVAIALAVLHGRLEVTKHDWESAGMVMIVHRRTREDVRAVLSKQARREDERKGQSAAQQKRAEKVTSLVLEERDIERAATKVLDKLPGPDSRGVTRNILRTSIGTKSVRAHLDEALKWLVENRLAEAREVNYRGQSGIKYRRVS